MAIYKVKRTRKDGTERIRYQADAGVDPATGKRRRQKFTRRADAVDWLRGKTEAKAQGKAGVTVADIGELFARDREKIGRERSTWSKYEEHFRHHVNAITLSAGDLEGTTLGDLDVGRLSAKHLVQFRADLASSRSHAMAKRVWSTLAAALDHAVAIEARMDNPARSVKLDRKPRETADPENNAKIPPREHIRAIHEALRVRPLETPTLGQAFLLTILASGCRPSELRALALPQLILDGAAPKLTVAARADQWGAIGKPKSAAGFRTIPLPLSAAAMLKRWIAARPRPKKGETWARDLVFPTSTGHVQNASNIHNRVWVPLLTALDLAKDTGRRDPEEAPILETMYPVYSLRHSYASIQIDIGIDAKTLQYRMGHASIQQTLDTYGHLFARRPERDAADMAAIDAWLVEGAG
jgi:integrase